VSRRFLEIVRFELAYYLRRISTYAYFAIFFALGLLVVSAIGGAFQSVSVGIGGSDGNVYVNSPYVMAVLISSLSLFSVLVTAAVMGHAVYRDYDARIDPLFFTQPIRKLEYLGGRFTGAMLVNLLIFASIPLGLAVACKLPFLDPERLGPFRLAVFVQPFLVFVVPNVLLSGAIFFTLAALTRMMLPNYVGGVIMLVGYMIGASLTTDLDHQTLAALADPFASGAHAIVTKYWTVAERNTRLVPLSGLFLYNRLIWLGVAAAIAAFGFWRFRFAHADGGTRTLLGRRRGIQATSSAHPTSPEGTAPAGPASHALALPAVTPRFDLGLRIRQYVTLTRRAFSEIVRSVYFHALVGAGLLFLGFSAPQVGKLYGTTTYPVTYAALEILTGTFALFMTVIIAFYAGELVWRERDLKANQVHDALPVPTGLPFLAKLTALSLVIAVLLTVILVAGVVTQALKGYFRFELGLYARTLYLMRFSDYVLAAVLALAVHSVVNHKYMGHMIVILYYVFRMFMSELGLEHGLYRYGSTAGELYSDMNGYGPFVTPYFWFRLYWAGVAVLLALATNLFWVRGEESGWRWRLHLARQRITPRLAGGAALAVALVAGTGGFIFYNTNILNEYRTARDTERDLAEYERRYKRFEGLPQPRIVAVDVDVALYPEEGSFTAKGEYRVVNRSDVAIDSVHVLIPRSAEIRALSFGRGERLELEDPERGYRIFRLGTPLQPNDTAVFTFDLAYLSRGFENKVSNTDVVENGSFVHSTMLPSFGYDSRIELSLDRTRRKYGLEPKERMAPVDDPAARMNNYISHDADWVDFAATVSTSPDQIAIAPGYLVREWEEGGRRYFRYEMDAPILHFYSFLSARYAVKRDRWRDVAIEVYYHPGHEYNLDRMIESVKRSLEYFTENFGPYQHRQVRIVEFPRYASFAQAFPNTIPYSEGIGFIARIENEEKDVDYPFYVTAHEVAHQWWAHQVIGGNVQGATLLSETLAQYSALMVMEREYGPQQMKRFLRHELDNYLLGRSMEAKKEVPLLLVENQGYIHYNKGSLVMYALRDYIGEERLNAALRAFLEETKFQGPPYANSLELLAHLEAATPDSLRYILDDLFHTITLYENKATAATFTEQGDGTYRVTLTVEARKLRADSLGNEVEVPVDDWIDIGVFGERREGRKVEETTLYLAKHRVTSGTNVIEVQVNERPVRAGIDPLHKLIDRHTDDNVVAVRPGG